MHPLTSVFLAAAGLLAIAGIAKIARPAATRQALRTQGLPARVSLVRLIGVAEVLVAVAALLELRYGAVLLAFSYAGFTVFVAAALVRRRPLSSCGCFAEPDVPPTPLHVGVTTVLAVCSGAVAAGSGGGVPDLLGGPLPTAFAAAAAAALIGWLSYLVLAELPRLIAALTPSGTARGATS